MAKTKVDDLLERLQNVRGFTSDFLEGLSDEEWLWQPSGVETHIAWQVGHMAISQYALCLQQVRGTRPEDATYLPKRLKKGYGKGSTPLAGPDPELPLATLRQAFDDVHRHVYEELGGYSEEQLDEPVEQAHRMFRTKLGSAEFAVQHDFVHAGQIALLRRLMGKEPLR